VTAQFTPPPLFDYQKRAIAELRASIAAGNKRIILNAPCRAGKTAVGCEIAAAAVAKGGKVLWIAHRRELVHQAFGRMGVRAGIILAGDLREDPGAPVMVASVQSLGARLDRIQFEPTIIVVDECHRTSAASYLAILERWSSAYVIGLTGTPFRQSGKGLGEVYQSIVNISTIAELLELGRLVPIRTYIGVAPDVSGIKTVAGDYAKGALEDAVAAAGLSGDIVKEYLRIGENRRAIYYCAGVANSKELCARFLEAGVAAAHIDGGSDKRAGGERETILKELAGGSIQVVCNDNILAEGYDNPWVSLIGFCKPTKSRNLWRQAGTRGMGAFPEIGKKDCLFLDHANVTDTHGFLTDLDNISLETGVKKPKKRDPAQCPQCGFTLAGWPVRCPSCGAALPRTAPEPIQEDPTKRLEEITEQTHRASCYLRMVLAAKAKGHRPGAAYVRFLHQFGEPPSRKDKGLVYRAKLMHWDDRAGSYVWTAPPAPASTGGGKFSDDDAHGAWPGR
jgi:superfamily II DNA or RNA helicase